MNITDETKPAVNHERVAMLVAALRSGDYQQGHDALAPIRAGVQAYCCLGVACELVIANDGPAEKRAMNHLSHPGIPEGDPQGLQFRSSGYENPGSGWTTGFMPNTAAAWYGFADVNPTLKVNCNVLRAKTQYELGCSCGGTPEGCSLATAASTCNDHWKLTFDQIADAFEATFLTDTETPA